MRTADAPIRKKGKSLLCLVCPLLNLKNTMGLKMGREVHVKCLFLVFMVNSINFNDRNVTVSLTYQELQALMRECVDYTMKNYSNEFDKLEGRKMVNAKEAAKLLGKNVSTIHRWKGSGYLHAKSVGGRDYFYMDEIKELTTLRAS